ncbi:hypothetical protein KO05_14550, partial [Listeria monocytogenes]
HHARAELSRPVAILGRAGLGRDRDAGGIDRRLPPFRTLRHRAGRGQPAAGACDPDGASADRADRLRLLRAEDARGRQAQRSDAADRRHRRHHGGAMAIVLPAELHRRQ